MFDQFAGRHLGQTQVKGCNPDFWPQTKAQGLTGKSHHPFAPAAAGPLKLPNRQGVEEFIGQQIKRSVGQVLHGIGPLGPIPGQRLRLPGAQDGRDLDQTQPQGFVKPRHGLGGAQDIGHQRAAAGAKFGQHKGGGLALIEPDLRETKAEKFAEHLADFGCRGEIARSAERVAGGIVAVPGMQQAFGHVVGQRDRPGGGNSRGQDVAQRRHAGRARQRNHSPTATMGNDSAWPCVSPQPPICQARPSGLPAVTNCASGWRTNSTTNRASP